MSTSNLWGVYVQNDNGGTNFYAVVAHSEQQALDIAQEELGVEISADAEPLITLLNEQYRGFAMLCVGE